MRTRSIARQERDEEEAAAMRKALEDAEAAAAAADEDEDEAMSEQEFDYGDPMELAGNDGGAVQTTGHQPASTDGAIDRSDDQELQPAVTAITMRTGDGLVVDSDKETAQELLDSAEFFEDVAGRLDAPAYADVAIDLYAKALGLDTDWHGIPPMGVKVAVMFHAVRPLSRVVKPRHVSEAVKKCLGRRVPGVSKTLMKEAFWVLLTEYRVDRETHTIPKYAEQVGEWYNWSQHDIATAVRVARVATALGVFGTQKVIVAASFASVAAAKSEAIAPIQVPELSMRAHLKQSAVARSITGIRECGVLQLLLGESQA